MRGESEAFFDNPSSGGAHAFGFARGFKSAVTAFDVKLQERIESLSRSLNEDL